MELSIPLRMEAIEKRLDQLEANVMRPKPKFNPNTGEIISSKGVKPMPKAWTV